MSASSTDDENELENLANDENQDEGTEGQGSHTESEGANGDESPTSQDDKKTGSIADAVRAALDASKEQSSGSDEGEEDEAEGKPVKSAEGEKPKEGEEEDLGELTEEELNSYKPKTRRRFEKLDRENKALTAKVAEMEPDVQISKSVQDFAKQNNLSREDINTGFNIMGLMRNDPVRAFEVITPIYQQLSALVGAVLPKDLQEQVNAGQIPLERAKELSRLRAQTGISTTMRKQTDERQTQQQQEEAQRKSEAFQNDVSTAITKLVTDWKATDPDFSSKQRRIEDAIELELGRQVRLAQAKQPNKLPKTVEEAVAFANDIKKQVEKDLRALAPKRNKPINSISGNGVNSGSKPAAKNMQDVVRLAIGQK